MHPFPVRSGLRLFLIRTIGVQPTRASLRP
jgi:hypothetical protein